MARPKLKQSERKTMGTRVRWTQAEYERIKKAASVQGMSMGELIRRRVLGQEKKK